MTAPDGADPGAYLRALKEHRLLYLPLVDAEGRVAGLVTLAEFVRDEPLPVWAVVMAGARARGSIR